MRMLRKQKPAALERYGMIQVDGMAHVLQGGIDNILLAVGLVVFQKEFLSLRPYTVLKFTN
jgi:hypothetical protein